MPPRFVVEPRGEVWTAIFHEVPLVRHDHNPAARAVRFPTDRRIVIRRAFFRIEDERDHIRVRDGLLRERDAHDFNFAAAPDATRPAHAGGVHDSEPAAMPQERHIDRVARRTGHIADQHALLADQTVDQRRLADVGTPDDGDSGFVRRRGLRTGDRRLLAGV